MATFPLAVDWRKRTIEGTSTPLESLTKHDFKKGQLEKLCELAAHVPQPLVWRLVFQANTRPFTPEQVSLFQDLLKRIVPNVTHPCLDAVQTAFDQLQHDMVEKLMSGSRAELVHLQDLIFSKGGDDISGVYFSELNNRLQNGNFEDQPHAFPRQDLSTKSEIIEQLDDRQWQTILPKKNLWNQMFDTDFSPITVTECDVYIHALQKRTFDETMKRTIYLALLNKKVQIAADIDAMFQKITKHAKSAICTAKTITRLRVMEIHIAALEIDQELLDQKTPAAKDAAEERKRIRAILKYCSKFEDKKEDSNNKEEEKTMVTFPITEILSERQIKSVSTKAWQALATKTQSYTPDAILNAMFTKKAMPITGTECVVYWQVLQPQPFAAHIARALKTLLTEMSDKDADTCKKIEHWQEMRDRINTVQTSDRIANPELKMIATCEAKIAEGLADEDDTTETESDSEAESEEEKTMLTFPITKILSEKQIKSVSTKAWRALATKTQSYKPDAILNAMFTKKAMPITGTECVVYWQVIQPHTFAGHIARALKTLLSEISDKDADTCKKMEHWQEMRDRINTVQTSDRIANPELKMIATCEAKIAEGFEDKTTESESEEEKTVGFFPISSALTKQQIDRIPAAVWDRFVTENKHGESQEILDAMFTKNAMPITGTECVFFWKAIQAKLGSSVPINLLDAFKQLQVDISSKDDFPDATALTAYLIKMQRRLQHLDVNGIEVRTERKMLDTLLEKLQEKEQKQDVTSDTESEEEEEVKVAPARSAAKKKRNERPLGSASTSVKKIDTTKPLLPAKPLRALFDAYFRHKRADLRENNKKFAVSGDFLTTLNLRLYEWVRDVMHFLNFTSQPDSRSRDENLTCQSYDISAAAVEQALELANPGMDLSNNAIREFARLVRDVRIPEPRKKFLQNAMLFYAQPLRRLTVAAFRVMETALTARLCLLVQSIFTLTTAKNAIKLAVCPALTTIGRVPNNKLTSGHFQGHASTMYEHPDNQEYVVVEEHDNESEENSDFDDDKANIGAASDNDSDLTGTQPMDDEERFQ